MLDFLRLSLQALFRSYRSFVVYNWLFFGAIIVGVLLAQANMRLLPIGEEVQAFDSSNVGFMVLGIFLFNLVLSGFVLTTLPGLVFFALPSVFLFYRAFVWGILLNQLFTPQFLAALPTLILEGEGYVLAAICGTNLGLSWFKPDWAYKNKGFSRLEALKMASRECVHLYFFVVIFLVVAAVVEAVTIVSFAG